MKKLLFLFTLLLTMTAVAQNPQSHTAPIFDVNSKYVNGVAPGYAPTPGRALNLNLGGGTVYCLTGLQIYSGGIVTLAANTINYVYLDPANSCIPTSNTTGLTSATQIPIAIVTTTTVITDINDVRSQFNAASIGATGPAGPAGPTGPPGSGNITASPQYSLFFQPNSGSQSLAQGDPNATTDGSGHVLASSLNGVYDMKAAFGASGSNQTMTCTATASSSTLTGCSGGDFKVGQSIVIPTAGVSATNASPANLTIASAQDNAPAWNGLITYNAGQFSVVTGTVYISLQNSNLNNPPASSPTWWFSDGSAAPCTGALCVTYNYQIAIIQGAPNGTLTPVGSTLSVTQAAQMKQAGLSSEQQDVNTTITILTTYDAGTTYSQGALVRDGSGIKYVSLQNGNIGNTPASSPSFWTTTLTTYGYVIYKQINSGSWKYYAMIPYAHYTFADFGNSDAIGATCTDFGVPCSPPSSATPNDVYAVITAINGSTITIAARSPSPVYNGSAYGLSGNYPAQPSVNGSVTVQHDDWPAFELMRSTLAGNSNAGLVKVHVPAGNYNLHSEATNAFVGYDAAVHLNGLHNVVIEGDGDGSFIYIPNDRTISLQRGFYGACGIPSMTTNSCTSFTLGTGFGSGTRYALVDPAPFGSNTVQLITPSQASNFSVGQWVNIHGDISAYSSAITYPIGAWVTFSGFTYSAAQITLNNAPTGSASSNAFWTYSANNQPYPYYLYAELNQVVGSDTGTGIVQLLYPTTHQYSVSLTQNPFTNCGGCNLTPTMTQVVGQTTASNLTIRNLRLFAMTYALFSTDTMDQFVIENNNITTTTDFAAANDRHVTYRNNHITEIGVPYMGTIGLVQADEADNDFLVTKNNYIALRFNGDAQLCTEGSTGIRIIDNDFSASGAMSYTYGSANNSSFANFLTMCMNSSVENNRFSFTNTGISFFAQVDPTIGGNRINGNDIYIDSLSNYIPASIAAFGQNLARYSNGIHVYDNKVRLGNAATYGLATPNSLNYTAGSLAFNTTGTTWAPLTYHAIPNVGTGVAGTIGFQLLLGEYTIMEADLTANLTSVTLTDTINTLPNLYFAIDFVQPSVGGPFTLPVDCTNSHWATGNANGLDCPNGAPVALTAAGSHTLLWFYEDAQKNVHLISQNNSTGPITNNSASFAINSGYINSTTQIKQIITADWTCGTGGTISSCVTPHTIGTLSFTLPLSAQTWTVDCNLIVGQATAATANSWYFQTASHGATNFTAGYSMFTAATAVANGAVTDTASTTSATQIAPAWTLGGTGTAMNAHIWGTVEGASASGTVVNVMLAAPTVGDLVTIYKGSYCKIL